MISPFAKREVALPSSGNGRPSFVTKTAWMPSIASPLIARMNIVWQCSSESGWTMSQMFSVLMSSAV